MAKVIKLKDRQGGVVLPLTRSQLVQVSQISGLDLLNSKSWTKASVQDALEALYAYASTNNSGYDAEIQTIKNALEGVLNTSKAVVNYVDSQDTAYLALAYAKAESEAATAQANSYAKAEAEATAAQANAYAEAAAKASEAQANAYAEAAAKATEAKDFAYAYTQKSIEDLDSTVSISADDTGKIITGITQTDGKLTSVSTAYLSATDIKRTATTGDHPVSATTVEGAIQELAAAIDAGGTGSVVSVTRSTSDSSYAAVYTITQGGVQVGDAINIPLDMVATQGELVHGSLSGSTFTPAADGDAYIKMTIANGDPFYIAVTDLIEYNTFVDSNEIDFTDTNHSVTAAIKEIDTDKIKHNNKSVTSYLTDMQTELDGIESTLVSYEGRIASNESDLSSYNTRISALETAASGLSYTVEAGTGESYITVTPSTSGNATTFTITSSDIASDTNLQALNTAYSNLNTELTNSGVFYEQVGSSNVDDVTLDTF